jgi:hypothetical protein
VLREQLPAALRAKPPAHGARAHRDRAD